MTATSNPRDTELDAFTGDSENPNPNGYYTNANPNYNADSRVPDERTSDICAGICWAAFYTLLIGGFITFMTWMFYHPDVPGFSVSGFDVSNFKLSSNSLTSDFDVTIAVRNPNKKWSIRTAEVHVAVLYSTGGVDTAVLDKDDFVIAKTPVFPFSQGPRNVTDVEARLGTVGFYADERRIRWGDGGLRFGVRVSSTVSFKYGRWETVLDHPLTAYCDGVWVGLKNSTAASGVGSMVGPAKGCVARYY